MIGKPETRDYLKDQGGHPQRLLAVFEFTDWIWVPVAQGPRQYGDTEDNVAPDPDRSADQMQCEYEPIHGFQFLVYELFSLPGTYGLMSWRNQSVGTSFPRLIG